MPRDPSETVYIGGVQTVPWVTDILKTASTDPATGIALNAVALTIVGRNNSDAASLREATRLYAVALSEVNRALQDVTKARSDEVLACCTILGTCV
jgi:hypothetical protein